MMRKFLFAVSVLLSCVQVSEAGYRYVPSRNFYSVQQGSRTMYFNGSRQPRFWTYQARSYGVNHTHVFQGKRRVGTVYGR